MTTGSVHVRLTLTDALGFDRKEVDDEAAVAAVVGQNGKRETVALINGFVALNAPALAQGLIVRFISGAFTTTLKGVVGDTGIALTSTALARHPLVLPLPGVGTPVIGFSSTGAGVIEVIWY